MVEYLNFKKCQGEESLRKTWKKCRVAATMRKKSLPALFVPRVLFPLKSTLKCNLATTKPTKKSTLTVSFVGRLFGATGRSENKVPGGTLNLLSAKKCQGNRVFSWCVKVVPEGQRKFTGREGNCFNAPSPILSHCFHEWKPPSRQFLVSCKKKIVCRTAMPNYFAHIPAKTVLWQKLHQNSQYQTPR